MGRKERVILKRISDYNPEKIKAIITSGLKEFDLLNRIRGQVTIKPNLVLAHHKVAPSAFTRAEFMDGLLSALKQRESEIIKTTIAEKTGVGLPTSRMFRHAGYYSLKKKHKVRILPIEEARKDKVTLKRGKIHQTITTAKAITQNDFLIYTPKLKTNVLSQGLTAAVKLNMGIFTDKERMWNHNFNLNEKIVDALEIGYPDFIATDAIEISMGGNQMTQHSRKLGIMVMAQNPVAHDVICARILNLDPWKIDHLRLAHERAYGPLDLNDIELKGDISLEELQKKTKTWDTGYIRVDQVDCAFQILCGEPYCIGGCHGVFLDWLYMIKDRKPQLWTELPEWTVVIGKYKGEVNAKRVMIIGSCSEIIGKVDAKKIRRIKKCPPKHKSLVLGFVLKAGVFSPLFRWDLILDAYLFLFISWCRKILKGRFR
jgi:uncharacterized protein (DUF362 family)